MTRERLLKARDLTVRFYTDEGQVNAVESVDIDLYDRDVLGIVGESGSGKSVTGLSVMGLIESPGRVESGTIWYRNPSLADDYAATSGVETDGEFVDVLSLPDDARRRLRADAFSMVFQDPTASFDPGYTVGEQIAEAVEVQRRAGVDAGEGPSTGEYGLTDLLSSPFVKSSRYVSEESRERAVELLEMVGLSDPAERADDYPHQYSGGCSSGRCWRRRWRATPTCSSPTSRRPRST